MRNIFKHKKTKYKVYTALTFVVLLIISQLLAYQQYTITRDRERSDLAYQLEDTYEKFETMLHHNVSSATTIVLLYYQDPSLRWFDSTAGDLVKLNPALDLTEYLDSFTTTHIYPLQGYERYLGMDPLGDPVRRAETLLAMQRKDLSFAGPFPMRFTNEKAIAGRQAVYLNGKFEGIVVVLTKLSTIARLIPELQNKSSKYVYQLSKVTVATGKREYFFEGYKPKKGITDSLFMPSGNWTLHAAYAEGYDTSNTVYFLALFGLLFSAAGATFVYFKTRETVNLEDVVKEKTQVLNERMKELSAIFQVSEVLKDERQSVDAAFNKVVNIIPVGWQHSDVCAARIVIDGTVYATDNWVDSPYIMRTPLRFIDDKEGMLEVIYCTEMPDEEEGPFLTAERDLITTLAELLMVFYSKKFHSERVARSEASVRSMIEATPVAIMLCDKKFDVVAVNDVMANKYNEIRGKPLQVGDNLLEALLPERRDEVRAIFNQVMEYMEPVSYDVTYDLDGGKIHLHVIATPVTCNAEPIGIATSMHDVTKRRNKEHQNRAAIHDLMQQMAELVDVARKLAGKVREPLATIKQLVHGAKAEKDTQRLIAILEEIKATAKTADETLNEPEASMKNTGDKEAPGEA